MTAEVAILNKQAVALAADSAVTSGGATNQKIFNTINKLFALSKYHPVGIMAYSSAEVMGIPIETVIKVFREKELGCDALPRLEDYYDRLIKFLKENDTLFPDSIRVDHCRRMIRLYIRELHDYIMRRLVKQYPKWGEPTQEQAKKVASEILQRERKRLHTSKPLPDATPLLRKTLRAELSKVINKGKADFHQTFALENSDLRLLSELCLDLFLREGTTGNETGFVIAGFGENEQFPQLRCFEFESSVRNVHKLKQKYSTSIDNENTAEIVPFAQTEMIETFVQGRAINFDNFLQSFINEYFEEEKDKASHNPSLKGNVAAIHTFLDSMNADLRKQFIKKVNDFTYEMYVDPILGTVSALPKEELALMAEALINLTSIKRRMSSDAETVGGPTDVAVISKGDGFVWINRKHYFKGELNPGFIHNYFREEKTV